MLFGLEKMVLLLAVLLVAGRAGAASFTASLERDTLTLGESTTLSLSFEGGQSRNVPTPQVDGLQFGQIGTSQSMSILNGAMTSTVSVNFTVTPEREGEFTIPALTAEVNGQKLSTKPLKLKVGRGIAPSADAIKSGQEIAFMKLDLPEQRYYVGQEITAQLLIGRREEINIANFRLAATEADGFKVGKMAQGRDRRIQIGNRSYVVTPVSVALTVERTGPLTLGPFTAGAVLLIPREGMPRNLLFQDMFTDQRQVSLVTEAVNAQGTPVPAQGKPADFKGALANFTITSTVGPTNLTAGDPVTVRVEVSGRGPLDDLKLAEPLDLQGFKVFQSTATITNLDPLGVEGTKIFELVAAPQSAGVHEWPGLRLTCNGSSSYFNPADGKYHTLATETVPLSVAAAGTTPLPSLAAAKKAADENQPPQDILPIKDKLGTLEGAAAPLVTRPAFLAAQGVPVLAFIAAFIWRKRADNLANNPRLRRQRAVARIIASGMEDLKKHAASNRSEEFFATLFRLLQEQLGERLDCPASAITENVIEEHPVLRGAPKATLDSLRDQFQLCNQARYAPVRGTGELNSVAAQFEKLIGQLREVKG
jgi:hypothetical protein